MHGVVVGQRLHLVGVGGLDECTGQDLGGVHQKQVVEGVEKRCQRKLRAAEDDRVGTFVLQVLDGSDEVLARLRPNSVSKIVRFTTSRLMVSSGTTTSKPAASRGARWSCRS